MASITFTDTVGWAQLTNGKTAPLDRFNGWTPATSPVGDFAHRQSDRALSRFRFSDDAGVNFELRRIPMRVTSLGLRLVEIADRLKYHLENGGTCTVATGDAESNTYTNCSLMPGTTPSVTLADPKMLEYTFSVSLINLSTNPLANLLVFPTDFTNAAWVKTNTIVNGSSITAPDGLNYTTIELNQNVAANGFIGQTVTDASNANQRYTFSVWLKVGTLTGDIALYIKDGADAVLATTNFTPTATWTRFSITGVFGASPAANVKAFIDPTNSAGTGTYLAWGATLEKGRRMICRYV